MNDFKDFGFIVDGDKVYLDADRLVESLQPDSGDEFAEGLEVAIRVVNGLKFTSLMIAKTGDYSDNSLDAYITEYVTTY